MSSQSKNRREAGRRGLRICHVVYSVYDTDSRVMRYTEALAARGDLVDVIALSRPGQPRTMVYRGVNVTCMQSREIDEQSKFSYLWRILLFFFRSMVRLTWRQIRFRYDIIHVHNVPDFLVFTALFAKCFGARLILDIHDLLPELYARKFEAQENSLAVRILLGVERISISLADHVITANDLWHDKLVHRSVAPAKATALVNYPDESIFVMRGRSRRDSKFVIMYPGSLNWHQGLDLAIRAFVKLNSRVPEAEFHIYGAGPALPELKELVKEFELGDHVIFKPMLPLRDIALVMENADLSVVPKRKDAFGNEAFSTKILEFMSLGVPVLVADTKVDTYYFNGEVVRFFCGGSVDDLARCMLELATDAEMRASLAREALKFASANSWGKKKAIYFDLIDSLLCMRSATRDSVEQCAGE